MAIGRVTDETFGLACDLTTAPSLSISQYGPTHVVVREWLLGQGLVEGRGVVVREYPGGNHNEASWRARFKDGLTFLYGDGS